MPGVRAVIGFGLGPGVVRVGVRRGVCVQNRGTCVRRTVSSVAGRGTSSGNGSNGAGGNGSAGVADDSMEAAAEAVAVASGRVEKAELADELSKSYMDYAMSVIMGRALPDARDGLKPVHRRILYAMYEMKIRSSGPYRKSARVVGEVLGKYHPHGDSSVYDALVRMAQPFSLNAPLVDGHGNFGSVDGDNAAAMRYTECRLSRISTDCILTDLPYNTVDFAANFDGSTKEPLVIPTRIPNLLISGSQGIAVGLSTKVPPYNLVETIKAVLLLLENPDCLDNELIELMPAPDFPTGGEIIGLSGATELFTTGKGRVLVRAKAHIEQLKGRSGKSREAIIVTELPYQVVKANVVKQIAELANDKQIEGISDLRDESDRDGMRIVIELSYKAHSNVVLNNLFKKTALQQGFSGNIVALDAGKLPDRLSVRACLEKFVQFRKEIVTRRCQYELDVAQKRFHIVAGFIVVLKDVDKTIEVVRRSETAEEAKRILMDPDGDYALSEEQADAVLSLQLRRITRIEIDELQREHDSLRNSIHDLEMVLNDEKKIEKIIGKELKSILKANIATHPRRSAIIRSHVDIDDDLQLIPNGRSVLIVTEQGFIKRMPIENFNVQARGGKGVVGIRNLKESDRISHFFTCRDHDSIFVVTKTGMIYRLSVYKIPINPRASRGVSILRLLPQFTGEVAEVLTLSEEDEGLSLLTVSKRGRLKMTPVSKYSKVVGNGVIAMAISKDDELKAAKFCRHEKDEVFVATAKGMLLRTHKIPVYQSRSTTGVLGMMLREGDEVIDVCVIDGQETSTAMLAVVLSSGRGKRITASSFRLQRRNGRGLRYVPPLKDDRVAAVRRVEDDDQLLLINSQGMIVRVKGGALPIYKSRTGRGVYLQRITEGGTVVAVDLINRRIREDTGDPLGLLGEDIQEATPDPGMLEDTTVDDEEEEEEEPSDEDSVHPPGDEHR